MKFGLDEEEQKRFREWNVKHLVEFHEGKEPYSGTVGGRISYLITSTSIGTFLEAHCNTCKRLGKPAEIYSASLTDTTDW